MCHACKCTGLYSRSISAVLMDVSTAGTYLHLINTEDLCIQWVHIYGEEQLFTVAMYVQSLHMCLQQEYIY